MINYIPVHTTYALAGGVVTTAVEYMAIEMLAEPDPVETDEDDEYEVANDPVEIDTEEGDK